MSEGAKSIHFWKGLFVDNSKNVNNKVMDATRKKVISAQAENFL